MGSFDVVYGWPAAETGQALATAEASVDDSDEAIAFGKPESA
jgi:hypothetical protein